MVVREPALEVLGLRERLPYLLGRLLEHPLEAQLPAFADPVQSSQHFGRLIRVVGEGYQPFV
jgi:hypothetical protein